MPKFLMKYLLLSKKVFFFKQETYQTSKLYGLLLILQIFNLNPNLTDDILDYLINQCLDSFQCFIVNNIFYTDRNNINQLCLANISLGFIFKPEITFNILQSKRTQEENDMTRFDKFIHLIFLLLDLGYPYYNPTLGKCIILGICGILKNEVCCKYLNYQKEKNKLYLLKTLCLFVINHKKEKNIILDKIMKKELKCNFVVEGYG